MHRRCRGGRLNTLHRENIDEAQLLATLDPLFASYATQRTQGERFGDWLLRSGTVASPTTHHRHIHIEVAA